MLQQVERLAPRLRTFSYATVAGDAADSPLPDSLWRSFHVLEKLSIDHDMPMSDALLRLPAFHTLQFREAITTDLDPRPITLKGVKDLLESCSTGLKCLRRLGLPAPDDAEPAEVAMRRGISEWCKSSMVKLYESDRRTFRDYSGFLEDALDFCELTRFTLGEPLLTVIARAGHPCTAALAEGIDQQCAMLRDTCLPSL